MQLVVEKDGVNCQFNFCWFKTFVGFIFCLLFFFIFCPNFSVSSDSSSLKSLTPNLSRLDNTVQDFNLFKLTIISTIRNGISVVNSVLKPYGHHCDIICCL